MRLGRLTHTGQLEPLEIPLRYVVMPAFEKDPNNKTQSGKRSFSKSTDFYKAKRAAFEKANADKEVVDSATYSLMAGIIGGLSRKPSASEALGGDGPVELSMMWIDKETQLPCKGRIDKYRPHAGGFTDLKTTRDALDFSKAIINYGYDRQAAFYQDGIEAITGQRMAPTLVAVETTEPFESRTARVSAEFLAGGRRKYREAMRRIAEGMATGTFAGYEDPSEWVPPAWYDSEPVTLMIGGQKVTI